MKKYTEKQKNRMKELSDRIKAINVVVEDRIDHSEQPLPLDLILEARFNAIMLKAIKLEGEIQYLNDELGKATEPEEADGIVRSINVKKRRLDMTKGAIFEMKNLGGMVHNFSELGREFTIG